MQPAHLQYGGKFMTVKYHQISLKESFSDCRGQFVDDTPAFFQLLDSHMNLDDFIPPEFYHAFYHSLGRKRIFPVSSLHSSFRKSSLPNGFPSHSLSFHLPGT